MSQRVWFIFVSTLAEVDHPPPSLSGAANASTHLSSTLTFCVERMKMYEKLKQEISNMSVFDLTQAHTTSRSFQFPIATQRMLQIIHISKKGFGQ